MLLKSIEYIGPGIILIAIFLLKLTVDESFNIEHLKKLIMETMIDIMSLAISFIVSFMISSASGMALSENETTQNGNLEVGLLTFIIYILLLIAVVFLSKYTLRKYLETEKVKYFILGIIIGYPVSVICLAVSISLLRSLGGA